MHPVATLDDFPSHNAIAANERVGLIEHGPFEHAKVRRRLRRESKHPDNDLAEPVGDTSGPGIGNDSCDTGVFGGRRWGVVTVEASAIRCSSQRHR